MKKTPLSLLIVAILVFSTAMSIGFGDDALTPGDDSREGSREYTHTVMVEVGTGSWCYWCQFTNAAMHAIYSGGGYDFEYVELVEDKNPVAHNRCVTDFNIGGYPTTFFDGGYEVFVGGSSNPADYTAKMDICGARPVPDIDANLNVLWLGNDQITVTYNIDNNDPNMYAGHVRAFVVEIVSRWNDYAGASYNHGFLGYAFNEDITIPVGGNHQDSTTWDASAAGYPGITQDNIQVILAVYNATGHLEYAYPPSSNPFTAYYVDETIAAIPSLDSPPTISNVQAIPSEQVPGGLVNITATVTDDIGVDTVTASITPPGASTPTDYPMTHGSGDTYYYETTYSTLGTYDYSIRAMDTGGNDATSATYDFLIWEYNPPIITNIQATTLTGDDIDITCSVQDDTAVDTVSINITDPLGGTIQASMVPTGGDTYTYSGTFATLGGYLYTISANDTAGNINTTTSHVLMRQMMYSGWNMVTLPLVSEHTASTLGGSISGCDTVCRFNGDSQTFTTHVVGIPYNDFPILDGVGYFIYVSTPGIFTATGECISSVTVHLYQQWNMIGWCQETATIASALGAALTDCTTICMYDADIGSYVTHVVGIPYNDFTIEWGMGLFVYTTSESDWQGNV